jgi:pyruvate/2-oxoglutarate dehydrogenase complex dihydrolipoamide acyltransferase (E2) component
MATADERATPGHFELASADGSHLQVAATDAGVSVYQSSGGTMGRGPASLTADEADQLAEALGAAAKIARGDAADDEGPKATGPATDHAAALGVDLADVEGTGKDGTVTKADVTAHAADQVAEAT